MKKIALFGGSFNPPHEGHFEVGRYIYETLGVDEVWFLFSVNWQKDPANYASVEHRMNMGNIMLRHYPDLPFVMTDIQERLGTHITHKVLAKLQEQYPDDRFIWVMGADNLLTFDTWEHYEEIFENFPIAVMSREPYLSQALEGPAALNYKHLQLPDSVDLGSVNRGWKILNNPILNLSSRHLLTKIRAGDKDFDPSFRDVVEYIWQNRLYGVNAEKTLEMPASNQGSARPKNE